MKTIGFTAGSFDLLHTGHILMLKECKENCDYLIVGFNTNPEGKEPVQGVFERFIQLSAVKYVDEIIPYSGEEELMQILLSKKIDVRFVGSDYLGKMFTGKDLDGIKIFYNKRDHSFSTTELKNRLKSVVNEKKS